MSKTGKDLSKEDIEFLRSSATGPLKEVCEIALATCPCPICNRIVAEARAKCVKAWNYFSSTGLTIRSL